MADVNFTKDFKKVGKLYIVFINGHSVLHTTFRASSYRYIFNNHNQGNGVVLRSYSQFTRDVNKRSRFEFTDAINNNYLVIRYDLFK